MVVGSLFNIVAKMVKNNPSQLQPQSSSGALRENAPEMVEPLPIYDHPPEYRINVDPPGYINTNQAATLPGTNNNILSNTAISTSAN